MEMKKKMEMKEKKNTSKITRNHCNNQEDKKQKGWEREQQVLNKCRFTFYGVENIDPFSYLPLNLISRIIRATARGTSGGWMWLKPPLQFASTYISSNGIACKNRTSVHIFIPCKKNKSATNSNLQNCFRT